MPAMPYLSCWRCWQVGPHICVLKTHVDLHTDFSEDFVTQLQALAEKHGAGISA